MSEYMVNDLIEQLHRLEQEGARALQDTADASELEQLRVELLGRKGRLTSILRGLGSLSPDDRPRVGAEANRIKEALSEALAGRLAATEKSETGGPRLDLSLPGRPRWRGGLHPVTRVVEEICEIFAG